MARPKKIPKITHDTLRPDGPILPGAHQWVDGSVTVVYPTEFPQDGCLMIEYARPKSWEELEAESRGRMFADLNNQVAAYLAELELRRRRAEQLRRRRGW